MYIVCRHIYNSIYITVNQQILIYIYIYIYLIQLDTPRRCHKLIIHIICSVYLTNQTTLVCVCVDIYIFIFYVKCCFWAASVLYRCRTLFFQQASLLYDEARQLECCISTSYIDIQVHTNIYTRRWPCNFGPSYINAPKDETYDSKLYRYTSTHKYIYTSLALQLRALIHKCP